MATSISTQYKSKPDAISDAEWQTRIDLAAAYRLVAHYGWDDMVFTHLSARVPGNDNHFLINPFGMLFGEITASSLVKVDEEANIIGETEYGVNPAGFTIHSAVHMARPEVGAVMHLHTKSGLAVSAQKSGLLPLTQTAMIVTPRVTYHEFEGVALNHDERERIIADLGDKDLMILRNHGTLAAGGDVPQTFMMLYFLEKACEAQVAAQTGGELHFPSDEAIATTAEQSQMIHMAGEKAWPALLRLLDRQDDSYRQ